MNVSSSTLSARHALPDLIALDRGPAVDGSGSHPPDPTPLTAAAGYSGSPSTLSTWPSLADLARVCRSATIELAPAPQAGTASRAADASASPAPASPPDALFQSEFGHLAQDADRFHQALTQIYGQDLDHGVAEGLRQRALQGDFSWLPTVQWVDATALHGANGAYDAAQGRVLLNADLRGSPLAASTFVEEAGHHLDTLLHAKDADGDEGELFRRLLSGEELSATQISDIRSENDHGSITVDGHTVDVEFWNPIKEFKEAVSDTFKSFVDAGKTAIDGAKNAMNNLAQGVGRVAQGFAEGGFSGARHALRDTFKDAASSLASTYVSLKALALSALVDGIDNATQSRKERGLRPEEIKALRRVYGDSIDYAAVRIQYGGIKNQFNMAAHVTGNTIWIPKGQMGPDGSINTGLLTHEMAHVWQYQNHGPSYMGDALIEQMQHGRDERLGSGSAYDWLSEAQAGTSFEAMNPESQAELIKYLEMSLDDHGQIDPLKLQHAIQDVGKNPSFILTAPILECARHALDVIRAGA